ncbi:MAG: AAA family ATPase, partial [Halothece sp.]
MLLQRIELKGFLSYYGQPNDAGKIKPVIIDFTQSPLWLIHGKNGTGKTAIFDAIRFALYKINRDNSKSNFTLLIHDISQKAEVKLEVQIKDKLYQIVRTIKRTKKSGKVWGIIRQFINNQWTDLPNTEQKVEQWVQSNLKMSYETFSSAVLLQQGNADAFMKAGATERRTRLLELLDLDFYKKLGDKATQRRNELKKELSKVQDDLDQLTVVTEEEIKTQEQLITKTDKDLVIIKTQEINKRKEKNNAENSAKYQEQIFFKQAQQKQYQELINQQKSILKNVQLYRELDSVIKQFDILWEKRESLSEEEISINNVQRNLRNLQAQFQELTNKLKKAKENETNKDEELSLINYRLKQLKQRQNELSSQLNDLKQVEQLEKQIQQGEEQLQPHLKILSNSQEVEQKYQRYQELSEGVPLLQQLNQAQQELSNAEAELETAGNTVNSCQREVDLAQNEKENVENNKKSIEQRIKNLELELQQCRVDISKLQEKLEHRESVSHAQECPTCGSHLDNPEIQKRLEQECQSWREQILDIKQQKDGLNAQLKSAIKAKSEIENHIKLAENKHRELDTELTRAKVNQENSQKIVKQKQQAVDIARKDTRIWLNHFDELRNLEIELQNLKTIPEEKQKLDNAKLIESTVKPNLDHSRAELEQLPSFSSEERQSLYSGQNDLNQVITECEKENETIQFELKKAQSCSQEVDSQKIKIESQINSEQDRLKDLESRKQKAEQEVGKYTNALSQHWKEHPAYEHKESLEELRRQFNTLSNAEAKEKELQEARKHYDQLTGEITTLQELLQKIPVEHCRPVAEIDNELEKIQQTIKEYEDKINRERQNLSVMENHKRQYGEKQKELDEVSKEFQYYEHLAKTLGAKELQAQIIQNAQEKIKLNANNTLARLSNGRWQIDLEENEAKTELAILAKDLRQSGQYSRL